MENKEMKVMLKTVWEKLTAQQREEAEKLETPDALRAYLSNLGIELPEPLDEDALNAVAGGFGLPGQGFGEKKKIEEYFNNPGGSGETEQPNP